LKLRHVLRSMVVANDETASDGLAEAAEVLPHALPDRLLAANAKRCNRTGEAWFDLIEGGTLGRVPGACLVGSCSLRRR
jgi:hypothetical protein